MDTTKYIQLTGSLNPERILGDILSGSPVNDLEISALKRWPKYACLYCVLVTKKPDHKVVPVLCENAKYAYLYCKVFGPNPKIEAAIKKQDNEYYIKYRLRVIEKYYGSYIIS